MPQLQNLVLTDRAATPVAHTFVPESIDKGGVASVVESSGVPFGNNRVTLSLTRNPGTGKYKGVIQFTFPIVQNATVNGVTNPVIVRTAYANLQFTFDSSSSEQERKDCVGMVYSALDASKTLINDMIVKLQAPY